jgi:PAS domain S-box-containing protein
MFYSVRNLIITFTLVIAVVLLIVLYTFSTLRSQERELTTIQQSREILQKLGPAINDMQEFESIRANNAGTGQLTTETHYNALLRQLQNDSANMSDLSIRVAAHRTEYGQLTALIHQMLQYSIESSLLSSRTNSSRGLELTDEFKRVANSLESQNRTILNASYEHTIRLTRAGFTFVRIIAGLLAALLFGSFWFIYRDIKNRKRHEQRLKGFNEELERQVNEKTFAIRESEKRYSALFESMTDAYAKVDLSGRIIEFNPAFQNMLGHTDDQIRRLTYNDITPSRWHSLEANMMIPQILARGYSDVYEKEYIRKDRTVFPVELRGFLLKNKDGEPAAIWAIVRDISARKEAAEKLAASEKNLRHVLSSTSDNFYVIDRNCRITVINEAAEKNLAKAWGAPIAIGTNILDRIPDTNEPIRESLKKVFSGEIVEYELHHSQGDLPEWVLVTYVPVTDETGSITGAYIVAKNITERKKAELLRRESEERYRALVENAPEALVVFDLNTKAFVNVSENAVRLFKMPKEQLLKLGPIELSPKYQPDGRLSSEVAMQKITEAMEGKKPVFEWTHRDKDGRLIPCEVWLVRLPSKDQVLIRGSIIDITERKRTEKEKERVRYLLNERIQELTTLYRSSQILQTENKSTDEVLQEIVTVLPTAWQYREITAARILLDKQEFKTINFGPGPHKQAVEFIAPGNKKGLVEVVYLEQKPMEDEDAFLAEERDLLNMIGEMLRGYLTRKHEAEVKEAMEQQILNQKVQEQKKITRALLMGQENERNKIGQELHDNINQILASIKLFLHMAKEKESTNGKGEILLDKSAKLINNAIDEIRLLSQAYVTPVKMVTLEELIRSLMEHVTETTAIRTHLNYDVDGLNIHDDLKLNIYRIMQEQINNIVKHARASQIDIDVKGGNKTLQVTVADDGKGFDLNKKRKGIGVSNMINRVESFNGELNIDTSEGKGTRLNIKIPC